MAQDAPPAARTIPIDGIAAFVNASAVTVGEVLAVMQPAQARLVQTYEGAELRERLAELYRQSLRGLIERRLILDAYAKEDMQLPDWVIDNRINEIIGDQFGGDRAALHNALREDRMTYADWRDSVREHLIVQAMRSSRVEQHVYVSPSELREAYAARRDAFNEPAQVRLRMIVLPGSGEGGRDAARQAAEDVRLRALAGEDFGLLARELSRGRKADRNGDWGWIEPALLRREIAEAVAALDPGEIGPVIETDQAFYVVKLEGRRAARTVSFEDAQAELESALRREKAEALYTAWTDRLWEEAYVRIVVEDPFE
jgi:peptidyl-prolyl cis-trans isomerase SurA